MQAMWDTEVAHAATAEVSARQQYRKAKTDYDRCERLRLTGCGYKSIAKKHGICRIWLQRYMQKIFQEDLDSSTNDLGGDDYYMTF